MLPINKVQTMYRNYQYGFTLINHDGVSYITPCSKNLKPIYCPRYLPMSSKTDAVVTFVPGVRGADVLFDRYLPMRIGDGPDVKIWDYLYNMIVVLGPEQNCPDDLTKYFEENEKVFGTILRRDQMNQINPVEHLHAFAFYKANYFE